MSFTATFITSTWTLKNFILDTFVIDERHTLDYVSTRLHEIASSWGVANKVFMCVHDGASNVKEAGKVNSWVTYIVQHTVFISASFMFWVWKTQ